MLKISAKLKNVYKCIKRVVLEYWRMHPIMSDALSLFEGLRPPPDPKSLQPFICRSSPTSHPLPLAWNRTTFGMIKSRSHEPFAFRLTASYSVPPLIP
jgi:hypothetical protein